MLYNNWGAIIAMVVILCSACGSDYPNNENHQDVGNDDCIDCHVDKYLNNAPDVPKPHMNIQRDDVDRRHKNCKRCHQQAD